MPIFRDRALEVAPGLMDTVVVGEMQAMFDALGDAFLSAVDGEVVMVATLSNACPVATG